MARAYRMTSARRAAIRKAQAASARKRRGKRRRNVAIGAAAGLGVIGVTMAASHRYRSKKRNSSPKNVIEATTEPKIKLSSSKEIDIIRTTIDDAIRTDKKGRTRIDFGSVGVPINGLKPRDVTITKRERKAKKQNTHTTGKRKIRVGSGGYTTVVIRNRPGRNEKNRAEYKPSQRRQRYAQEKARKPPWLSAEHRAARREAKRNKNG